MNTSDIVVNENCISHKVDITKSSNELSVGFATQDIFQPQTTVQISANPVSVFDVAAYILCKLGTITTIKLQKLVYYCQAWSLVWDEQSLFEEPIEAWINGPVVRTLFAYHRGNFQISEIPIGVPAKLSAEQKETINAVLNFYGNKTGQQLVEITHLEDPWKIARTGMSYDERGERIISLESMMEYYTSIADR